LTAEAHAVYRKREGVERRPRSAERRLPNADGGETGRAPERARAAAPSREQSAAARLLLRGDYGDGERLAAELRAVVGAGPAVVELDGASFLGDDAARVLRRAIEAAPGLEVRATRPAIRRWLGRHGIRVAG
jgi:hypothetical protein